MQDLKLLHLIARLAKDDVTVKIGEEEIVYKKPSKVSISALFFRDAPCGRCGRSCNVGFNLYYTENEYYDLPREFKQRLRPFQIFVNEKEKTLWTYKNPTKTKRCDFVKYDGKLASCLIHEYNPIHCALPHIQVDQRAGNTILTKRQYGRNHKFGCPMKWGEFNMKTFTDWDLQQLKRLRDASRHLNIPTHLDKIIHYLVEQVVFTGIAPQDSVVIYEKA